MGGHVITHSLGGATALPREIPTWTRFTHTATIPEHGLLVFPHLVNNGGDGEFYVECLASWGGVIRMIGKGKAYRGLSLVLRSALRVGCVFGCP